MEIAQSMSSHHLPIGTILVSTVVSAKQEVDDSALHSHSSQTIASSTSVTPACCLSMDRHAVAHNSAGDDVPGLASQLSTIQSYYKSHLTRESADAAGSALFQFQLSEAGPRDEVLGYYEGPPPSPPVDISATPPDPVASLFSCHEVMYLQDPPPTAHRSATSTSDLESHLQARQLGHRWQSVFQAPLTIFDDRYGATNFWRCFQQILYKGAFGFEEADGERYGVQLQGIAVPVVETDENLDTDTDEEDCPTEEHDQKIGERVPSSRHTEIRKEGKSRPDRAEGKSFDLFHFYSNVQRCTRTEELCRRDADGAASEGEAKRRASKCHVADAQDLYHVSNYLESFVNQIEAREGPAHLILYVTFVDVHDTLNRRSFCFVRLDDVSLDERLLPNEFRVAEVLEMLVEELALALNAGASPQAVFTEDEGVQLATECSRLTQTLRKVMMRDYEKFLRPELRAEMTDALSHVHWLFNLPEGTCDAARHDDPVIRVKYADPDVAARVNLAMEVMVELQEVNMECAHVAAPPAPQPMAQQSAADESVVEESSCTQAPLALLPSLQQSTVEHTEEAPLSAVEAFSPRQRRPHSQTPNRRRSVVTSVDYNTALADASPFSFLSSGESPISSKKPTLNLLVSEEMWQEAVVCEGTSSTPRNTLADQEITHCEAAVQRRTQLALCRVRSRAVVFMEATPLTLDLPESPSVWEREPTTTADTRGADRKPNVFHRQMLLGMDPARRRRSSVRLLNEMFHRNRMKRRQRREQMVFTLV